MKNIWDVLFVVYFIGYWVNNVWDFTHPGREPHWMHNPYWNAAGGVAFSILFFWMYWHDWKKQQRKKHDARKASMIETMEALLANGRREEAAKAYAIYLRVESAASEKESRQYAKQFSDLVSN